MNRRGFLKSCGMAITGIAGVVPSLPGIGQPIGTYAMYIGDITSILNTCMRASAGSNGLTALDVCRQRHGSNLEVYVEAVNKKIEVNGMAADIRIALNAAKQSQQNFTSVMHRGLSLKL